MNKYRIVSLSIFIVYVFSSHFCVYASELKPWESILKKKGYELSEEGVRQALETREFELLIPSLKYIEKKRYSNLTSNVKSSFVYWEAYDSNYFQLPESSKLIFISCLFSIDTKMSQNEINVYMARIRRMLYEVKKGDKDYLGSPTHAYVALVAAKKYKGVDIFDDLLFISITNTFNRRPKHSPSISDLFKYYGDEITDSDIDMLLENWSDWPARQDFILSNARAHGKRLEETPVP